MTTQERGATRNSGMGQAVRVQGKAVPVSCEAVQSQLPLW